MKKNINVVLKYICKQNLEHKTIDFVNSIFGKKILYNPNYLTFHQWISKNGLFEVYEDESKYSWYFDEWSTHFGDFKENWPWIVDNKYFIFEIDALKYFFRKNPTLINEFLEKQTLV